MATVKITLALQGTVIGSKVLGVIGINIIFLIYKKPRATRLCDFKDSRR